MSQSSLLPPCSTERLGRLSKGGQSWRTPFQETVLPPAPAEEHPRSLSVGGRPTALIPRADGGGLGSRGLRLLTLLLTSFPTLSFEWPSTRPAGGEKMSRASDTPVSLRLSMAAFRQGQPSLLIHPHTRWPPRAQTHPSALCRLTSARLPGLGAGAHGVAAVAGDVGEYFVVVC